MNFLEWNIIKDDFALSEKLWNEGHHSWNLVNCDVLWTDGKTYKWCLHFDEYMYRKCVLEKKSMEGHPIPLSILENLDLQISYWSNEIKERKQGEEDAGEDL